jgi:DNA-binding response OmpR family regulator
MGDPGPRQLDTLSAHVEGLRTAAADLDVDPSAGDSIRRIARSLQSAAESLGAAEIAAGSHAILRATEAQLARSVTNFLERIEELRRESPAEAVEILLVEDNKTVAAATTAYLTAGGWKTHVAATASEAEAILAERDIDLVVLDLILPDRDGRDLLVQMREQASTAAIPVIVLSARGGPVTRTECLAVGADAFLEKPTAPGELRTAVSRLVRRRRDRRDETRDHETGLPNRVGVAEALEGMRRGEDAAPPGSVVLLEVEPLGVLLETHGSEAALDFLRRLVSAVGAELREGETLGRWTTRELVAVLPERPVDEARAFVEAAVRAVADLGDLERLGLSPADPLLRGGVAPARAGDDLRDAVAAAERDLFEFAPTTADPGSIDEADRTSLETPRILVVEDDNVTGTLIHHRLIRDGHEVFHFVNGEDAFEWASRESFDLAVLDVKVPGMDGFEILERLRRIPRLADVPVVMLTGMGGEADVVRGLDLGADDYMLKPFSPTELLARVRRLLHARAPGGDRRAPAGHGGGIAP